MTHQATAAATYPLPWGTTPDGELTTTGTIFGAIIGTLGVFMFLPLAILGIILNCMGLDRVRTDPGRSRGLMRTSWIILCAAPVVGILLAMLVQAL